MKDFYKILNIDIEASDEQISMAYQVLLSRYPLEMFPNENTDIEEAYEALANPYSRMICTMFCNMLDSSKAAYNRALDELGKEKYGSAIKLLEDTIKKEQNPDCLYYLMASVYTENGVPALALDSFEYLVKKYPHNDNILRDYAIKCIHAEKVEKALEYALKAYRIDSNNIGNVLCLADAYLYNDKLDNALIVYHTAISDAVVENVKPELFSRIAFLYFLKHEYSESLKWLDKLLDVEFDENQSVTAIEIMQQMSDLCIRNEMYEYGLRIIDTMIEIFPTTGDLLSVKQYKAALARVLYLLAEFDELQGDEKVPDIIIKFIAASILPSDDSDVSEEEKEVILTFNRIEMLSEYKNYIIAVRYIKNKYPKLFNDQKDFFEAFIDEEKRRRAESLYFELLASKKHIVEELIGNDDNLEDEFLDDETSNVIPFIRPETKVGRNDVCHCGSGLKYKNCCGKNK